MRRPSEEEKQQAEDLRRLHARCQEADDGILLAAARSELGDWARIWDRLVRDTHEILRRVRDGVDPVTRDVIGWHRKRSKIVLLAQESRVHLLMVQRIRLPWPVMAQPCVSATRQLSAAPPSLLWAIECPAACGACSSWAMMMLRLCEAPPSL